MLELHKVDINDIKKRINELRASIAENNRRYYVESAPVISDYEFDMLMNELAALEKAHPELVTPDSPTQKVGSDLRREFDQYPHRYPMLSLGNTYDMSEVEAFADRAVRSLGTSFTFCCELKFDGTAICLTYRDGKLFRALTRGDGTVGDDVTENVRHISNIPQELHGTGFPAEFEIRGEIYMPYKAFDRLNEERLRDEDQPFANPRNAASGSLKLINPREVSHRGLECTLYHVLGENLPFATHEEALEAAAPEVGSGEDVSWYDLEVLPMAVQSVHTGMAQIGVYGEGFPEPVLKITGPVDDAKAIGEEENHLSFRIAGVRYIAFRQYAKYLELGSPKILTVYGTVSSNWYKGRAYVQVNVMDFEAL